MNGTPIRELAGQTWLFDDCKVSGKDSEVSGKMMGADGEIEQHTCVCTFYQFRSPAEVRWLAVVGPKNDGGLPMIKVFSGIVSLQADTLRWCVSFSGDTSPKEFDSNKGDSQIFYILRRAKAKKKP